jgi:hypothetical protein
MGGLPMMCFAALAHDVDAIRQMAITNGYTTIQLGIMEYLR